MVSGFMKSVCHLQRARRLDTIYEIEPNAEQNMDANNDEESGEIPFERNVAMEFLEYISACLFLNGVCNIPSLCGSTSSRV